MYRSIAILFLLSFTVSAEAVLQFETTRVDHEAGLDEKDFIALFPFTNTGEEAVTVTRVKSSCGCTVPTLEKKTYEPGESGTIEARFSYGSRVGRQAKRISVSTSDKNQPTTLELVVEIPVRWTLTPRVISWPRDEADGQTKSALLEFPSTGPMEILKVENPSEEFELQWTTETPGHAYQINLVPTLQPSEGARRTVTIIIEAGNSDGQKMRIPLYLRVY